MAQLQHVGGQATMFGSTLAAFCLMFGLVFTLLGIKIWWFKHRLHFDHHPKRNGAAGSNGSAFGIPQRSNSSSSRDRHRQQVDGAAEVHGVFRKRQEDEWDPERATHLPPIRLSESTPDLSSFSARAAKPVDELPTTSNATPPYTKDQGPIVPKRKRKERFSRSFENLQPPTRTPPRPPIITATATTSELRRIDEIVMPDFPDYATQFKKVEIRKEIAPPPRSITPSVQLRNARTPSPIRYERNEREPQSNNKFLKLKAQNSDLESPRRATGFFPPDHGGTLHATSSAEAELLRKPADAERDLNEQSDRNSYIEYEKVDEYDSLVADNNKWETFDSVSDEVEIVTRNMRNPHLVQEPTTMAGAVAAAATRTSHFEPIQSDSMEAASVPSILVTPPPSYEPPETFNLFADLEHTTVAHTVDQLWQQIEQQSDATRDLANDFHEFRHSFEMNEAHILDVRQEPRELAIVEELVSTPTGYGKSIDEDWENFENLGLASDAEKIFEPRMEHVGQLDRPVDLADSIEQADSQVANLFHDLEIPAPIEVQVVQLVQPTGPSSFTSESTELVETRTDEVAPLTLPDYDTLMADDVTDCVLPDYETAVTAITAVTATATARATKDVEYVSSIEDLYDELQQQEESHRAEEVTESAYITNIDELFEELGLEHKSSIRYPTESYLDAKCDHFAFPSTSSSAAAPKPAQRRKNHSRLKVRFDIASSQYYQPEELSPDSEASSEYDADDSIRLSRDRPKARQRLTKLSSDSPHPSHFTHTTMPAMLFGAQIANLDDENANNDAQASSSWLAISKLRAMQSAEQQELAEQPTRLSPKPALRKTSLLQDSQLDERPVAATRKISAQVTPAESNLRDAVDI